MFDYIITAFSALVGAITNERLAIVACILVGILFLWILFSLFFSVQTRFSKKFRMISDYIEIMGISSETYPKFMELASKLPDSFLRGWKTFEHAEVGLPSEYIKRNECVDLEINGGYFRQNRSFMKIFIVFFSVMIFALGLASKGSVTITAYMLGECLALPIIFAVLCSILFFIYVAIIQKQFKTCVADFNEMIDILNEKVEDNEIEFAERKKETEFIKNISLPAKNKEPLVVVEDKEEEQVKSGKEDSSKQGKSELASTGKKGRGRTKKEKVESGELIIKSDAEFESVLAKAEKLMKKNEEPLSVSQQKRVEKSLKELVDAMKKYKGEK